MSYIGKTPIQGNFQKCDAITTSSTNTYNLLVDGVAVTPQSALNCLVSLNGVIQSANSAYSISGSQITFIPSSGTLTSDDVIDFIIILGDVGQFTTVTDDSISTAKIQNDSVTIDKINLISTSSAPSLEAKGDGSSQDGYIQLNCSQNSHGVKIKSPPHSAGQSHTLVLPDNNAIADGHLHVKSVTGSGATAVGQLEFKSFPTVDTSNIDASSFTTNTIPSARMPAVTPAQGASLKFVSKSTIPTSGNINTMDITGLSIDTNYLLIGKKIHFNTSLNSYPFVYLLNQYGNIMNVNYLQTWNYHSNSVYWTTSQNHVKLWHDQGGVEKQMIIMEFSTSPYNNSFFIKQGRPTHNTPTYNFTYGTADVASSTQYIGGIRIADNYGYYWETDSEVILYEYLD